MSDLIQRQLIGSEIIVSLKTEDGESFGFRVKTRDKRVLDVWVDCDAEGNGPGWLAIQKKGKA
jgi:hypothetical protein